mgnify:FL=1
MEFTFVITVKEVWQLQQSWLYPCKVCDQGRSVGKIKFTRNTKMVVGCLPSPTPHTPGIPFSKKVGNADICSAFLRYLK